MAMSLAENEILTSSLGASSIERSQSVSIEFAAERIGESVVSPWLTRELQRLFPCSQQTQPGYPSPPRGEDLAAEIFESRAGYVQLLDQTQSQHALLRRQAKFNDANALERMMKWLIEKVEEIDTMKSFLQPATKASVLPLSPTSPIGLPQDSPFYYPPAPFSPTQTSSMLRNLPESASPPIHFPAPRSFFEGGGNAVGVADGCVDPSANLPVSFANPISTYASRSSFANSPSTYAIALSSSLAARGKPPYFPDESGRNAKSYQDSIQGGLLCNFCKNNGEREGMFRSHCLKDSNGVVLCPVLRAYTCPKCGAKGDNAHTIKYCPVSAEKARLATLKVLALNHKQVARIGGEPFAEFTSI